MHRILIVDDDVAVTNYFLVFFMQTDRFETEVVNDSTLVPELLQLNRFDVILLDMDMPGLSGMDILQLLKERDDDTPVVVLTGVGDVDLAVRAMKLGAFDYLTKPADEDRLLGTLDAAIEHHAVRSGIAAMPTELDRKDLAEGEAFEHLPTSDPAMVRVLHQAERMAASDLTVFLLGERGVGKEAIARAIHRASRRRNGPFVALDASAMESDELAASLFGQVRDWAGNRQDRPGFLEEAEGGTLFLDEVDVLPPPLQVRLKRLLQRGEFNREASTQIRKADVRVVAATTRDLAGDACPDFNRDLLYHLMVNSLVVPPLRDRPTDIPMLAEHFLKEEARAQGRGVTGFDPAFMDLLMAYDFPDNTQELRTIVSSALAAAEGPVIGPDAFPPAVRARIRS
ncbi:MAG: sigma-54-dependent Fis family transcriptional regulator [Deltaproteobacteria bacterium]|nr:sigma-54-dependent Fis family transcriptional regulator [Deltaproteobacteria bacterium]